MNAIVRVLAPLALVLVAAGLSADDKQPAAGGGFIGVRFQEVPGASGLHVMDVIPDGPAAKAGLKGGDVIVKLDGKDTSDLQGFVTTIGSHKPGDKIALTVKRDGKDQEIKITVGARPTAGAIPGQPMPPRQLGGGGFLGVAFHEDPGAKGVVIADLMPDGPAAKAGLKANDHIVKIDDKEMPDMRAFAEKIGQHKPGDKITLKIERDGKEQEIKVTLGERPKQ